MHYAGVEALYRLLPLLLLDSFHNVHNAQLHDHTLPCVSNEICTYTMQRYYNINYTGRAQIERACLFIPRFVYINIFVADLK